MHNKPRMHTRVNKAHTPMHTQWSYGTGQGGQDDVGEVYTFRWV